MMNKPFLYIFGIFLSLVAYGQETIPEKVGEEVYRALSSPHPYRGNFEDNVQLVWRQEVYEKDASYIAFHFSKLDLHKNDYLIVRNPENTRYWKYSFEEIQGKDNSFWSIHIYGEHAVIEIFSTSSEGGFGYEIDKIAKGFSSDSMHWGTRAICGNDDSENAVCYENTEPCVYERSRPVARLLINGISSCTGWLIGDEGQLITNEHCIGNQGDASNTTYEFMAEGANCGSNCNTLFACPGQIEATSAILNRVNADLDYALLDLPTNVSGTYGFLQLRASGAELNERIYIPQHPRGWGKRIALFSGHPNDAAGFARIQSLTESGCTSVSYQDVGYFADTQAGSSGSPVIGYDDNLVIALHHCADCLNRGVPIQHIIQDLGNDLPNNSLGPFISGPEVLCSSNSYTLQDLPPGTTATWTASPSHLFSVSSGTGVTANLGPSAAASGPGTLTYTISGSCGTVQVSKQVWVGKALPSPTFIQGPYEMAVNTVHNFYVNPVPTATNYQWSVYPSGNEWIGSNGNSGITLSISAAGSYSLEVDITNPCGVIGLETPVDVSLFSALFTAYPNPASEELHIEMIPSEKPEKQGAEVPDHITYEIKLFDPSGTELHSQVASGTKVTLNVRHLDNGFYYIHILHKEGVIRKKIRVQR